MGRAYKINYQFLNMGWPKMNLQLRCKFTTGRFAFINLLPVIDE